MARNPKRRAFVLLRLRRLSFNKQIYIIYVAAENFPSQFNISFRFIDYIWKCRVLHIAVKSFFLEWNLIIATVVLVYGPIVYRTAIGTSADEADREPVA